MPKPFGDLQNSIYLAGLGGQVPSLPTGWRDLEAAAAEALSPEAWAYIAGGSGGEDAMAANRAAFSTLRLVPRMLREVTTRDLTTTLLGTTMAAPVLLAPVGVLSIAHPDAERAVAKAAAAVGLTMILSTAASTSIEDVAEVSTGPRWYQLYWPGDRVLAASFVRRAEAAGYGAVVVTLDTWQLGWRPRDLDHAYLPFLRGEGIANYLSDPVFRASLDAPPEDDAGAAILQWSRVFSHAGLTWADLAFLREHTSVPLLVKGVCAPEDARAALDAGVDGIVVSNHGGRQLDGAVAALEALPRVVEAVAGACPVLFDSGIRTGADALKALALGAEAVLLGRPWVWGLALGGEEGVATVLRSFLADFDVNLALLGHRTPGELGPADLAPAGVVLPG